MWRVCDCCDRRRCFIMVWGGVVVRIFFSKILGQLLGDGVGVGWMNFFQKRLERACSPASAAWRVEEGVGAGVGVWVDK